MPEDDADAFEEILHFMHDGRFSYDLPKVFKSNIPQPRKTFSTEISVKDARLAEAYVLAKKWGMEHAQNAAVDDISASFQYCTGGKKLSTLTRKTEDDEPCFRILRCRVLKVGGDGSRGRIRMLGTSRMPST